MACTKCSTLGSQGFRFKCSCEGVFWAPFSSDVRLRLRNRVDADEFSMCTVLAINPENQIICGVCRDVLLPSLSDELSRFYTLKRNSKRLAPGEISEARHLWIKWGRALCETPSPDQGLYRLLAMGRRRASLATFGVFGFPIT